MINYNFSEITILRCSNLQPLTAAKFHGIVKPQSREAWHMAALRSAATSTACALTTALTARESVFASTGRSTQNVPQIEETTAYGYRGMIENYLKPQLGEIRLQKLVARDIQQYYTWLMDEKELSPNTVIKHHNLLTNALNAAERQEYIMKI
ncbi:hypothetical protein DXA92_09840 [Agathobaculum butyriciproducens]|jgi:hypothetical protein|nr:hypothetical protein DXA94_08265 [Agathobaculum butyriciproducens]RGC60323.1 hypothetical protein DXA92_09840 [Agathobaculum butyriciproducens]